MLGARANEKAVKTLDLTRYRVVAFATHGLVPGDLDGLASRRSPCPPQRWRTWTATGC